MYTSLGRSVLIEKKKHSVVLNFVVFVIQHVIHLTLLKTLLMNRIKPLVTYCMHVYTVFRILFQLITSHVVGAPDNLVLKCF